ncbi:MAG: carboxylating nicotinate-nucleotide diphosphorylase [Syntrophomonadaceae bacterium]|nr:carboxylating nicotinate-nucleotide diphosphorylase [Syntrophomonadaceae bacterium]
MEYIGLNELIDRALQEDIGHGDITTESLIPEGMQASGVFVAKSAGILAGINVSRAVFRYLESGITFETFKTDGDTLAAGDVIARVTGKAATLLTGERVALNFLQRLSGIATKTRRMVELIKYLPAELVDTRKTTPGLRVLEKYAVAVGGARNHRFGLYDGVMIKDNHIKAVGSITGAVSAARQKIPHTIKVEVEVENLEQLEEALQARADIILLDNMDIEQMKKAVEITAGRALLEASGGINEDTLAEVAKSGVDFISSGALTHSAVSLDISFNLTETW